jgi:hypothetical protein
MKSILGITIAVVALSLAASESAQAAGYGSMKGRRAHNQAQTYPWHGMYYEAGWNMPVALVVPPKVENQVKYSWGVGSSRVVPIEHQFSRNYPGSGVYRQSDFRPTPRWPSDTDQLGIYYVRGPWKR